MKVLHPLISVAAFFASLSTAAVDFVIEKEFEAVTCGSSIKLAHSPTGYRLHSHQVTYGTGSGQQSVTGFAAGDDTNSLFVVEHGVDSPFCKRGQPVKCGDSVRLQHINTKNRLHSHAHVSPLSNNQEVSAYGHTNTDDNWQIVCTDKKDKVWKRESKVRLLHVSTQKYLSANAKHKFGNPIPGQLEICAVKGAGNNELWIAQEGIYFAQLDD